MSEETKDLDFSRTGVLNGSNTYNGIIYQSFKETPSDRAGGNYSDTSKCHELVDVVGEYPWSIDAVVSNNGKIINVPHCYAIEYQQRYTSSITNLINSLYAFGTVSKEIPSTLSAAKDNLTNFLNNLTTLDVSGTVESVKGTVSGAVDTITNSGIGDAFKHVKNTLGGMLATSFGKITNPISNMGEGHYLQPYSLLYDMSATGLKYCFPMISNPPTFKVNNTYDSSEQETSILSANSLFSTISSLASSIVNFNRDLSQFNGIMSNNSPNGNLWERTNVEKAKFFQYPQQTETYTITFPLINTVKTKATGSPVWIKNYKFILLFAMRNMIFRKDNTSFYPPLFYDLTIPGVIRQPFTYVESLNVQPMGMVRMLECKKLFNFMGDKSFMVPVPEAWIVTINFKSLLATSANLVLSALNDSVVASVKG